MGQKVTNKHRKKEKYDAQLEDMPYLDSLFASGDGGVCQEGSKGWTALQSAGESNKFVLNFLEHAGLDITTSKMQK